MKKLYGALFVLSLAVLASCNNNNNTNNNDNNDGNNGVNEDKIELKDSRVDLFTAVSGSIEDDEFVEDGDTANFKSLYEASNYCYDNYDNGSYVYRTKDTNKTPLYTKRANEEDIAGAISDQWFYYRDGSTLDGYSNYLAGDTEYFKNEKVIRMMASTDNLKYTYQPYKLLGRDETASTASWNRRPMQDATIEYNPHAFTGIRTITFTFNLSEAKIRPSYSTSQKVIPMVTLSSTDSYNWSNQGIWMDTANGNWYYLKGETQADTKALEYDNKDVLLTSTWSNDNQEWTPNSDVTMTLTYRFIEEDEVWVNDLSIQTKDNKFDFTYEYYAMNGRGTPRANISLDLVSTDEDLDDTTFGPDFMCGAYFKNIVISKGEGTVPEGLTDDEYQGDDDMCCEAGKTYGLTMFAGANDADTEVILDNYGVINYHEDITNKDVYDISYEQNESETARSSDVTNVESLIAKIAETDDKTSASVIKANTAYSKLHAVQAKLVTKYDGYTALEKALEK